MSRKDKKVFIHSFPGCLCEALFYGLVLQMRTKHPKSPVYPAYILEEG